MCGKISEVVDKDCVDLKIKRGVGTLNLDPLENRFKRKVCCPEGPVTATESRNVSTG